MREAQEGERPADTSAEAMAAGSLAGAGVDVDVIPAADLPQHGGEVEIFELEEAGGPGDDGAGVGVLHDTDGAAGYELRLLARREVLPCNTEQVEAGALTLSYLQTLTTKP